MLWLTGSDAVIHVAPAVWMGFSRLNLLNQLANDIADFSRVSVHGNVELPTGLNDNKTLWVLVVSNTT